MAPHGNRRAPVVAPVAFGTAELRPDLARPQGWTVFVDGVEQSYVDLADPCHLAFPYIRRLAAVLDATAPGGVPLTVLHLGGGGLTLPRYVAASRPGSTQRVVERDAELLALVTQALPPPPGVVLEVGDARRAVEDGAPRRPDGPDSGPRDEPDGGSGAGEHGGPDGYDVIVVDVFDGARMPDSVAGVGFAAAVARLLRPGGLLGVNLTDLPPLAHCRIQAATLRAVFDDVGLIAGTGMLRGRRAGNVVLVAGRAAGDVPVRRLAAAVARDAEPARLLHGTDLAAFVAGARARLDTPN
jgi:spermidine synthase